MDISLGLELVLQQYINFARYPGMKADGHQNMHISLSSILNSTIFVLIKNKILQVYFQFHV